MEILLSGASGFIGSRLKENLRQRGHKVSVFKHQDFGRPTSYIISRLQNKDAVIHLGGYPIIKRWTKKNKERIYSSRVDSTQRLADAIKRMEKGKPGIFISTSAVGIYKENRKNTEDNPAFARGFLAKVCMDWENAAKFLEEETRLVIFRLGLVLGRGGALKKMILPFRLGMGGKLGDGKQDFPWVHVDDVVAAYTWALEKNDVKGVYNLVAPQYADNQQFTKALAEALNRPAFITVPAFAVKFIYGKAASVLLKGQRVFPLRLTREGFEFQHNDLLTALKKTV